MPTAHLSSHVACRRDVDPGTYRARAADKEVLYAIIRDNLETFLREAAHRVEGASLPHFVEQEFRDFLTCGLLAHGFARVRCDACTFERLVPFSCKGRGFCPSCGGRRMTERAARLVDEVLPRVPVRQWVLSLPHRLRYRLAWNHALCRAVLRVFVRVLLGFQRSQARRRGILDGTGHLLFDPLELLEKLAALTPRPRVNLVLYHGVLAPHARWRPRAVSSAGSTTPLGEPRAVDSGARGGVELQTDAPGKPRHWTWADLMRRAFDLDVLACPRCGGRMRLIATIEDPRVIRRILAHLRLPTEGPDPCPSRPPPGDTGHLFADLPA